jgi:hypothetical protein
MDEYGAMVELYGQGVSEVLEEKPLPVPFRSPQIPHGLVTTVTGCRPTAGAMERPAK